MSTPTRKCDFAEIIAKRELLRDKDVNPDSFVPEIRWDFFTLYEPDGTVLCRSKGNPSYHDIILDYEGVVFICSPGYDDAIVAVEWISLVKWGNK